MFRSVLLAACVFGATPDSETGPANSDPWLSAFGRIAAEYDLRPDSQKQKLELVRRPTYKWARSGPHGGTYGAVYVWTKQGCAEAVACFWRSPAEDGKISVAHELHTLSSAVLTSQRPGPKPWKPKSELKRHVVPDAPIPAETAARRMQQMRAICRDFAARSVSSQDERTELRLLPQPLYRYDSTRADFLDGGLFAYVCSVGTDPEVFLLLEAMNTEDGPRWHYALARFSHFNLFVDYKGRQVWQSVRDQHDTIAHSADDGYWLFHEPFDENLLGAVAE